MLNAFGKEAGEKNEAKSCLPEHHSLVSSTRRNPKPARVTPPKSRGLHSTDKRMSQGSYNTTGMFRKHQEITRPFKLRPGSEVQTVCRYIDGEDSFRHVFWEQLALDK